ncbi:hypothetical protein B0H63DRAFT_500451 [Podospora didyma]|uniref:Uncharacterized protein n=1 Tax=Podospora didyma TaxID=330526 RepID=A0AAE0U151_9PEZI|nr:hypothetical protein B0H63DRAFT_500451 [Podospora didyma]
MLPPNKSEAQAIAKELLGIELESADTVPVSPAFFTRYNEVFCHSNFRDAVVEIDSPVLTSHGDVLRCARILKGNPAMSHNEFMRLTFANCNRAATSEEKKHATKAIVSAAFMINCASKDYCSEGFSSDTAMRVRWEGDQGFSEFVEQAFIGRTLVDRAPEQEAMKKRALAHRGSLKAWNKDRVLKVFHQTMFLQAQLKRAKDVDLEIGFEESLKLGILSSRLLLETLVSIHCVLFPVVDIGNRRSMRLLKRLIRKEGFDPEATWFDFVRPIPEDFRLHLYDAVKRPRPANSLVAWFERRTSERNALTVAILGLFLAVLFGPFTLVVGILQLVVAWLSWKYPSS